MNIPTPAAAAPAAADPYILLGVMSNPTKPRLRDQWRDEWGPRFGAYQQEVKVRFVFGDSFYEPGTQRGEPTRPRLEQEEARHSDLMYVDGREKLPHVGVVTEKSAAFWRSVAVRLLHRL